MSMIETLTTSEAIHVSAISLRSACAIFRWHTEGGESGTHLRPTPADSSVVSGEVYLLDLLALCNDRRSQGSKGREASVRWSA